MGDREAVRISDLCGGILLFLVSFRRAVRHADLDPRMVRHTLRGLFAEFEEQAKKDARTYDGFDKARYLLAVTADDLALGTEWNGAREWQMFEEEFYGSRIGGTKFYEHLEDPTWRSPDMNEVFFLCLAVGFRGKYMIRGKQELDAKREELFLALREVPKTANRFTPQAYEETLDRPMTRMPIVSVARIAILLVGAFLVIAVGSKILFKSQVGKLGEIASKYAAADRQQPGKAPKDD